MTLHFGWNSNRFRILEAKDKKLRIMNQTEKEPHVIPWYRICSLPLKCDYNKLPMMY